MDLHSGKRYGDSLQPHLFGRGEWEQLRLILVRMKKMNYIIGGPACLRGSERTERDGGAEIDMPRPQRANKAR
jgi:hypothetical protein